MSEKVIIIGSGFGGLSVAARLAAKGYEVEIFEKRDKPGGRGYVYEIDGFKFDGGPTVITAPFMFDDIFEMAGRRRAEYVEFVRCDPFYRIFDYQGRAFDYNSDPEFIYEQIEKRNPADVDGYRRFISTTKDIFEKGFVELADKPFLHIGDMIRVIPALVRLQSYKFVYTYVSQFMKDDFLRRCFSFHPFESQFCTSLFPLWPNFFAEALESLIISLCRRKKVSAANLLIPFPFFQCRGSKIKLVAIESPKNSDPYRKNANG